MSFNKLLSFIGKTVNLFVITFKRLTDNKFTINDVIF